MRLFLGGRVSFFMSGMVILASDQETHYLIQIPGAFHGRQALPDPFAVRFGYQARVADH